jgi:rare lipoprotein A
MFSIIFLTGCSISQYSRLSREDRGNLHYKGHYKVGSPYVQKGEIYIPRKEINYKEIGYASWYGKKDGFHGKKTANGDKYNKEMLTAAHTTLPMPSLVKVTNLKNNKSLILMVNDRGPFSKKRIIDVSEKAATILGFKHHGIAKVHVEYLHKDTQDFLKKIAITPKEGSKAKGKTKDSQCSVNCHIKLVNIEKKLHSF